MFEGVNTSLIAGLLIGGAFGVVLALEPVARRAGVIVPVALVLVLVGLVGPERIDMAMSGGIGRYLARSDLALGSIIGLVVALAVAARPPRGR